MAELIRCSRCGKLVRKTTFCPYDGNGLLDDLCGREIAEGAIRIDHLLGEGGFGRVYRATLGDGKVIALKVLKPEHADDPATLERWKTEVEANFRFVHEGKPHAIRSGTAFLDFGSEIRELHWFAMDFCRGLALEVFLDDLAGPPELALVLDLMDQVLDVIAEAHDNGIVHKDIHPFNIFIEFIDGGRVDVKVVDFGIAELTDAGKSTEQDPVGREKWMSPEQALGLAVDERSDVFNLGMLLYLMLTGVHPFIDPKTGAFVSPAQAPEPPLPSEVGVAERRLLLRRFDPIVRKALRTQAHKRYPNAGRLKSQLEHALGSRHALGIVVVIALLIAGAAGVAWTQGWLEAVVERLTR